ncbi:hypothetical protein OQA88_1717 [Cercophora sp. LCS_1]
MPNKRPRVVQPVDIEIPLASFKKYVPGSGPPSAPLTLLPPHDSTGYIIDQFILPPPRETTANTRRLLHYYIGFTDLPTVKLTIPGHKILDYVSPRELEDWEYKDFERRQEEKARRAAEAPPKKRPGRPPKKRPEDANDDQAANAAEDALLLAKRVAGPSLSTPQKPKLRHLTVDEEGGETSNLDSDDAIRRQLHGDSDGSELVEAESQDDVGLEDEPAEPIFGATASQRIVAESSSRSSSVTLVPSEIPTAPPPAHIASPLGLGGSQPPRSATTIPTLRSQLCAPTPGMLHPAWLQSVGSPQRAQSTPGSRPKNGSSWKNGVRKETAIKPPLPPNFQAMMKQSTPLSSSGFTPLGSSGPRPHPSIPRHLSTPTAATSSSPAFKPFGSQKKQSTGTKLPKEKTSKEKQSKKGKEKAKPQVEVDDLDEEIAEDEWKVKELLDDRHIYDKGRKVHMYLVNWEGDWPPEQNPTWEPAENIQDDNLIIEYRRRKKAGLLKPDKHQKTLNAFFSKPQYSNVAEAFEADLEDQGRPHTGIESDSDEPDELLVTETSTKPGANGNHLAPTFSSFDAKLAQYQRHFR